MYKCILLKVSWQKQITPSACDITSWRHQHSYTTVYKNICASTASTYDWPKAVDGNLGTWFCSRFGDLQPWWRVDLLNTVCVYRVEVLPRGAPDDSPYFHTVEVKLGQIKAIFIL